MQAEINSARLELEIEIKTITNKVGVVGGRLKLDALIGLVA